MKNSKLTIKKLMTIILTVLVILLFNSCEDFNEEEISLPDSTFREELIPWNDLLNQLDLESEIAFVQNGGSIQEAINAALSGDIIYIEPGIYQEELVIKNSDVKLIGLSRAPNDLVINNAKAINIEILKLYEHETVNDFQRASKEQKNNSKIIDFSRTELGKGIVHYQFNVKMGDGEFDVVRIHRVVREKNYFRPVPTKGHIFMVHGAFAGFEDTFLQSGLVSSSDINAKTSAPFYLASKNIDVWGIDMGWTKVPNSTTEFGFMEGWGYEKDADHTLKAMGIARIVRGITGQGFSGLNVLGFSSGNTVAYTAANKETQQNNMNKRHIKGLISVDNAFKIENGEDSGCASAQAIESEIAAGMYQNTNGQFFNTLGYLAQNFPDDISPILGNPITNIQAYRLVFAEDAFGFGAHFLGGDFSGLFYSDETRATRVMSNFSYYMPHLLWQEIDAVNCSSMDVTFDDYINSINVPIFYLGTGGAFSTLGEYTGSITASNDVTSHVVSLADRENDFGHIDLWIADNADQLVWSNLRSWIGGHR